MCVPQISRILLERSFSLSCTGPTAKRKSVCCNHVVGFTHTYAAWLLRPPQHFLLDQLSRPAAECLIPEPARSNIIATILFGHARAFDESDDAWSAVEHDYSLFLQRCAESCRIAGTKLPSDLLERLNTLLQLYLLYEILFIRLRPSNLLPDPSMVPLLERAAEKIEVAARELDVPHEIRVEVATLALRPGQQLQTATDPWDDDD